MNNINIKDTYKYAFIGHVIRQQDKTIVVEVITNTQHKKYKKVIYKSSRYMVHDSMNSCCIGDLVLCQQSKPQSSKKKWKLAKILKKNCYIL